MTDTHHHELWSAVRHLANAWTRTPVVPAMTSELPKNAPHLAHTNAATVTSRLQGMSAGAAALFTRPLRLGNVVDTLRNHQYFPSGPGPKVDDNTLKQWLNHAHGVEAAHDATIAWLRSRLPGYPILRIPYIAPNTHLTANPIFGDVPWNRADLGRGVQALAAPENVPFYLGATAAQAAELNRAANQLAQAVKTTPEWEAFATAQQQLTADDKAELTAARTAIKGALRDFNDIGLNMYESHELRRQIAYDIIGTRGAAARKYCRTFDDINGLIQLAASDVLGQLVAYGEPATVSSDKVDLPRAGTVHIAIDDKWAHHPGDLVRIDDPLLPDVMQVHNAQANINPPLNLRPSTLTLRTIPGTSVWF